MITYYFLYLCVTIVNGFATVVYNLPNAAISSDFTGWLAATGGYIATATKLMPLTIAALFVVIALMIIVENADGIFKVVKWIYMKIPGIN